MPRRPPTGTRAPKPPGDYILSALVTGADGSLYHVAPRIVHIPVRVAFDAPYSTVVLTDSKPLRVRINLAEGLIPAAVAVEVDGQAILTRNQPPFEDIPLETLLPDPGVHRLAVRVTDRGGAQYVTRPQILGVARTEAEVAQVQDVVSLRIKRDEAAEQRRRDTALIRRRVANARAALAIHPPRRGAAGHVNGLAVVTQGNTKVGELLGVAGNILAGTGKTIYNGRPGDKYILQATANAAAFCRNRSLSIGLNMDWRTQDIVLGFTDPNVVVAGNSAGAAFATALMSILLKLSVDTSVAMTGTVSPQGAVGAVGGVEFKAVGAFSNASIRTLIVPGGPESEEELYILFQQRPELFVGRRLIYANNMEQVLRQALIGYDKNYDRAEQAVREGIRLFTEGFDEDALAALERARQWTPEDATIRVWIRVIRQSLGEQARAAADNP